MKFVFIWEGGCLRGSRRQQGDVARRRYIMSNQKQVPLFAAKDLTMGELNALVKICGGEAPVRSILADELRVELTKVGVGRLIHPAAELCTQAADNGLEALWVDLDLARLVNLDHCSVDFRPLKHMFKLSKAMNDSTIAQNVGGHVTLVERRTTIAQLATEINLARRGERGLFKKGRYYIIYIEGSDGSLIAVDVCWRAGRRRWQVACFRFDQDGEWIKNSEAYGN
jgi:hypothetical protein